MRILQRNEAAPYWLPWAYGALFSVGAYLNNVKYHGKFSDFWIAVGWLITMSVLIVTRKSKGKPLTQLMVAREGKARVLILVTVVTALAVQYYVTAGIPIFSDSPDTARMEFMQGTLGFRVLSNFVPFMVLYLTSWLVSAKFKWTNLTLLGFLLVLQMFVGGKASLIVLLLLIYIGCLISNKRLSLKVVLIVTGVAALGTLLFFRIIMGLDSYSEAAGAVITRVTETSEYGLYVTVNNVATQMDSLAPVQFIFDVFEKYFGSGGGGYTPSLGRQITAQYYGGGVFDYVWELTVSIFGDFYILAGWFGVILSYVLLWIAFSIFWKRYKKSTKMYVRCFYVFLWFKTVQLIIMGSIAAQLVISILPFAVFWSIGYLILWSGITRRRAVLSPLLRGE
jgi:hypothetical protein